MPTASSPCWTPPTRAPHPLGAAGLRRPLPSPRPGPLPGRPTSRRRPPPRPRSRRRRHVRGTALTPPPPPPRPTAPTAPRGRAPDRPQPPSSPASHRPLRGRGQRGCRVCSVRSPVPAALSGVPGSPRPGPATGQPPPLFRAVAGGAAASARSGLRCSPSFRCAAPRPRNGQRQPPSSSASRCPLQGRGQRGCRVCSIRSSVLAALPACRVRRGAAWQRASHDAEQPRRPRRLLRLVSRARLAFWRAALAAPRPGNGQP